VQEDAVLDDHLFELLIVVVGLAVVVAIDLVHGASSYSDDQDVSQFRDEGERLTASGEREASGTPFPGEANRLGGGATLPARPLAASRSPNYNPAP
jgi:hypothetical protein